MQLVSMIGEIEGHESASSQTKTTKYEHMLPILASLEESDKLDGIVFLINTVGGDVSYGLALAEMIAGLSKPTVALVVGDSHSIGVPLSVAADYTVIAPSATVIIHSVRMTIVGCGRLHSDRPIGDSDHSSGTHERNGAWSAADI